MATVIQYQSGMSNGFFVEENGSVIAVDGGALLGSEYTKKALDDAGIMPEQIRLLVITHGHVDHFVNMDELRKLTGAPLLCHEKSRLTLEEARLPTVFPRNQVGRKVDAFRIEMTRLHGEPVPYLPPMRPDLTWAGTFDLAPYGIHGRIIETPGHSDSDTSVVLDDRQAIVGDLLVNDEFTDGVPTLAYFGYDPDPAKANELLFPSCHRLLELADTFYSGHGGPFSRADMENALRSAEEEAAQTTTA